MSITDNIPVPLRFYTKPDTLAYKLEEHILSNNIESIGELDYRDKNRDKFLTEKGGIRPASVDLSPAERRLRTVHIKKMQKETLEKMHIKEQKIGRLFTCLEIGAFAKYHKDFIGIESLNTKQVEAVAAFQTEHRPILEEIWGFKIPPYFIYDCKFDGMQWHHSFDWNLWVAVFVLPLGKKKTVADEFD